MDEFNRFGFGITVISIDNQKETGTCWIVAGLNMIRYKTIKNLDLPTDFKFSTSHLYFWSKLESINECLHLACETKLLRETDRYVRDLYRTSMVSDGNYFWTFKDLVEKYGLMPDNVFKKNKPCEKSNFFETILEKEIVASINTILKYEGDSLTLIPSIMTHYKKIIATVISVPPTTFTFRYKKHGKLVKIGPITPIEFYKNYSNIKLEEYIYVMANKRFSNNKVLRLQSSSGRGSSIIEKNYSDLFNVSLNRINKLAKKSILHNNAVYFDSDTNYDMSKKYYLMDCNLYNYDYLNLTGFKLEGKNNNNCAMHSMVICGVDIDSDLHKNNTQKKIVKWEVQNSWGCNKTYVMTGDWFLKNVYGIVIHIDMLTEKEKKSYIKSIKGVFNKMVMHCNM